MIFAALPQHRDYELNEEDFSILQKLIEEKAGIHMSAFKRDLLKNRLRSHVEFLKLDSMSDYVQFVSKLDLKSPDWQIFINSITTNKTDFFREPKHFDFLIEHVLPTLQLRNQRHIDVWCCAASTGEEPYTLSMCIKKNLKAGQSYQILASDIDTDVLSKAKNAVYQIELLATVPDEFKEWAFCYGTEEISRWVKIKKEVKELVTFTRYNLVEDNKMTRQFDVVFCRNVLIYFTRHTIEKVIDGLYHCTKPGGFLFIGHSESLQGIKHRWTTVGPSIFQKI